MRVFLDAKVLFSAAAANGHVRHLIGLLIARGHECWVDAYVVSEARRNLAAKRPEYLAAVDELTARLHITPPADLADDTIFAAHLLSEKDRPVLAAAIRSTCEALVTGDRAHFGSLYGQKLGGVTIHSPSSLAEALFPG